MTVLLLTPVRRLVSAAWRPVQCRRFCTLTSEPSEEGEDSDKELAALPVVPVTDVEAVEEPISRCKEEFRVKKTTNISALGFAMELKLRDAGWCEAIASGEYPVTNFVKGAAAARRDILGRNEGDVFFQAHHCFWQNRNSCDQIWFVVTRRAAPLQLGAGEQIRVGRKTDIRGLAMSIRTSVSKGGVADVHAMGASAIARCVVASIWARRFCMTDRRDIDCYPSIYKTEGKGEIVWSYAVKLTVVQRAADPAVVDSKALFALRPFRMKLGLGELPFLEEAFDEAADVEMPIVKVGEQTHPNKAANTLLTYLRNAPGVQLFSSGLKANNQAFKAIAVCRRCVLELPGYDLGFQCIHYPRENRNGECQVVTFVRLIQNTAPRLAVLEADKVVFRVMATTDAKSVAVAMAHHIELNERLECSAMGSAATSRLLTALSHAREVLASKGRDLVALPGFDAETEGRELFEGRDAAAQLASRPPRREAVETWRRFCVAADLFHGKTVKDCQSLVDQTSLVVFGIPVVVAALWAAYLLRPIPSKLLEREEVFSDPSTGVVFEGEDGQRPERDAKGELAFRAIGFTPWPVASEMEGDRIRIDVGPMQSLMPRTYVFPKILRFPSKIVVVRLPRPLGIIFARDFDRRWTFVDEIIPGSVAEQVQKVTQLGSTSETVAPMKGDVLRGITCSNFVYPLDAILGLQPPQKHIVMFGADGQTWRKCRKAFKGRREEGDVTVILERPL